MSKFSKEYDERSYLETTEPSDELIHNLIQCFWASSSRPTDKIEGKWAHYFLPGAKAAREIQLGYPLEIRSGALEESRVHPRLFDVQANTSRGLVNLHAVLRDSVNEHDLRDFLVGMDKQYRSRGTSNWSRGRSAADGSVKPIALQLKKEVFKPEPTLAKPDDATKESNDWRFSASQILARLRSPSSSQNDRIDAALFSEVAQFEPNHTEERPKNNFPAGGNRIG